MSTTFTAPQERQLVTVLPGPRSRELAARRNAEVAHAISSTLPIYIERAQGGVIVDVDGNSLIDFGSGIAVTNVGNAAPDVVRRVQEQAERFTHTCFLLAPYEGYVEICAALNRLAPGNHEKRTALFNSGAEAVENAVKFARSFTGRQAVAVFDHAFHGRTNLAMAMTAKAVPYKQGFGPFAGEIYRAPMSYPFRDGGSMDGAAAAARAIDTLHKQVGAANLAALVIEPIQGEGGFIVPAPGFLPALVEWCRENGILFIADEIQTGIGRTGDIFACEHESIVPDLLVTAKGLAGGLPLSAVTGRADVMDAAQHGGIGGTYSGNPLACAAAVGTIESLERDDLAGRARQIGRTMIPTLEKLATRHPVIGQVRGRGAMVAIELVRPGTREPDAAATAAIARRCHENGLVVLQAGTYNNVLRLLPPLVIPEHLLTEGLQILEEAVAGV